MNAFLPPLVVDLQATNDTDVASVSLVLDRNNWHGPGGETGLGGYTKALDALDAAIAA